MRRPLYQTAIVATYLTLLLPLTIVAAPLPTAVSPRGTLLRGGAEIFPFGIYHTSWIGDRYGDERGQDLLAIHGNGLRILQTSLDPTSRQCDFTLLDDAVRHDMGVMAELYLPALGTLIDHMKNHPAIISWQIGDDFNVTISKNYCSPELLKKRHQLALAHDPYHVTYASGGSALVARYRSFKDYQGCVNLVGIQCYPVGNKPDFPDELTLERCFQLLKSRVSEIKGSGIIPIANLQSFSWTKKGTLPAPSQPVISVLCRTSEQAQALAAESPDLLYLDFEDLRRFAPTIETLRKSSQVPIFLATPRIQKAGETGFFRLIENAQPDGVLIRNLGGLDHFRSLNIPIVGDFSLNISNPLSADLFISEGLQRVTPSYDLNISQLLELLHTSPPSWFELTLHQHIPMFHMEHCVFAAFLSEGKDHLTCGRPCDRHRISARDRVGESHPIRADVGCRNTVFHARPQSGASHIPQLLATGLRHFRLELLEESPEEAVLLLASYRKALLGHSDPSHLAHSLGARDQLGVLAR